MTKDTLDNNASLQLDLLSRAFVIALPTLQTAVRWIEKQ
jgi:hypothetical protein